MGKTNYKNAEFIDIHNHILPGIDDGAQDMEISLQMLRIAEKEGINRIILTPHFKPGHRNASPERVRELMEVLQERTAIMLYAGNEVFYQRDAVELLDAGEIGTLAGSRYVLAEFLPGEGYEEIRNAAYGLLSGGYLPIIAHAERCQSLVKDRERIGELTRLGAYIQVNTGSIMGRYGLEAKSYTRKLLKRQMVHFVATDAHDTGRRAPAMKECAEYLAKRYGEAYTKRLLIRNPQAVLKDDYL